MTARPGQGGGTVRPLTALAFATATFVALLIFGLGMVSLALGEDVIATSGLGQAPGIVATVFATIAFAIGLWLAVRSHRSAAASEGDSPRLSPSYWGAAWTTAACFLAYVGGLFVGAVTTGADLAAAAAAAGRIATTWFGVVVAAAALVSAWGGIALVRTRASRPRWPWEDEFDE
ncbi:hypothetical protein [Microbacterium deminutum]|uniref:Uncharacterized protein n=1 Tax=Microbacterium deminutum TaxID=344164 RepID=A0ABP5BFI0_9MICO